MSSIEGARALTCSLSTRSAALSVRPQYVANSSHVARVSFAFFPTIDSDICRSFAAAGKYSAIVDGGAKVPLVAAVAFGVTQYSKGENPEELYRRARMALDENRKSLNR